MVKFGAKEPVTPRYEANAKVEYKYRERTKLMFIMKVQVFAQEKTRQIAKKVFWPIPNGREKVILIQILNQAVENQHYSHMVINIGNRSWYRSRQVDYVFMLKY